MISLQPSQSIFSSWFFLSACASARLQQKNARLITSAFRQDYQDFAGFTGKAFEMRNDIL